MIPPLADLLAKLEELSAFKPEWDELPLEETPPRRFWIWNNWFGPVDAEIAYAILRQAKPRLVVEVGAGMSTLLIRKALQVNRRGRVVSIDPEARADVGEIITERVENVDRTVFSLLSAGDVLFIDSSHIFAPGGDIDVLYHEILPALPSGVIVHVHDIFLPAGYPSWWAHRGYDEADHLRPLLEGGDWRVLWSSQAIHLAAPAELRARFRSYRSGDYPASLWMVRS